MTRTAGAPIGCQRPSRFWGLGCPKIYHEAEDTLVALSAADQSQGWPCGWLRIPGAMASSRTRWPGPGSVHRAGGRQRTDTPPG
ncbi:hypothetical protein [Thiolapillus sp.]|uniref:hypothetical protein n=1 Tax=Thiolapillus sp. TaxID=2017437 RepID=UPI0025D9B3A1|nr:hypothetical protein [Thiolapillus sp.]